MKKAFYLILFCVFGVQTAFSQIQFSTATRNGEKLKTVPRISWRIPYYDIIENLNRSKSIQLLGGVALKNEGVIFDEDTSRYKFRVLALGGDISLRATIRKRFVLTLSAGGDLNLHYKEKVFVNGERSQKEKRVSEWFSERTKRLNPYGRVTVGYLRKPFLVSIFTEYYPLNFVNPDYVQIKDNQTSNPYQDLNISRFNIGITVEMPSEKKKNMRNVPSEKGF